MGEDQYSGRFNTKKGETRKKLKEADFGIIRKQIFHRITYPKSSTILLGEMFLYPI